MIEFKTFNSTIEDFQLQEEDTRQIAGYVDGLRQEYPEARISQFVIYCIGNRGFRVFEYENDSKPSSSPQKKEPENVP